MCTLPCVRTSFRRRSNVSTIPRVRTSLRRRSQASRMPCVHASLYTSCLDLLNLLLICVFTLAQMCGNCGWELLAPNAVPGQSRETVPNSFPALIYACVLHCHVFPNSCPTLSQDIPNQEQPFHKRQVNTQDTSRGLGNHTSSPGENSLQETMVKAHMFAKTVLVPCFVFRHWLCTAMANTYYCDQPGL